MRVLHLIPGNLYGGVESFIALLARRTDLADGLDHHFAICFEGRLSRELDAMNAPVYRIGGVRASRPWTVIRGRRNLSKLIESHPFDAAVCHSSWPLAMFGSILRKRGVPTVFYLHGPVTRMSWVDRLASRNRPRLMIAVSQDTLATGRRIFSDTRAEVLHYPRSIAPEMRDERIRATLGAKSDDIVLIQVSRLDEWKGHRRLIESVARLRDLDGWKLWIAGGPQRAKEQTYLGELQSQVAKNGLSDRVNFLGERDDVPRLLAGADVFCQANTGPEGFSIAFMEAFAARLPIVTTSLGGASELIDPSCGVLAPAGDVRAIADAIRLLVTDRALREQMGAAGETRVRELCDPSARFADLKRLLESAMQKN